MRLWTVVGLALLGGCHVPEQWPEWRELDEEIPAPAVPTRPSAAIFGVAHADLLVVSDYEYTFVTRDGGIEWEVFPELTQSAGLASDQTGQTIAHVDHHGNLKQTHDGGDTWTTTNLIDLWKESIPDVVPDWEDHDLTVSRAYFSEDLQSIYVVAFCEVLLSTDSGKTWEKAGAFADEDRLGICASELFLNADFHAQYANAYVTGTIASGDYVYVLEESTWRQLCTFDLAGIVFDKVTQCKDVSAEDYPGLSRFDDYSGPYPWPMDFDYTEAIFERGELPSVEGLTQRTSEFISSGDQYWYIGQSGIARSDDAGKTWKTLEGGAKELDDIQITGYGLRYGLHYSGVFESRDGRTWQRNDLLDQAYNLQATEQGVLASTESAIQLLRQDGAQPVLEGYFSDLVNGPGITWAISEERVAASVDGGVSWVTIDVEGGTWHCFQTCLGFTYSGDQAVEIAIHNGELVTRTLGEIASPFGAEFSEQWIIDDVFWLVEFYDYDSDDSTIYQSIDNGKTWEKTLAASESPQVNIGNGKAAVIYTTDTVILIDKRNGVVTTVSVPTTAEIEMACVSHGGTIYLFAYGRHPRYEDKETLLVWSGDGGENWFTEDGADRWCDD